MVLHQTADQSVSSTVSVPPAWPVSTSSVPTPVLECVASMPGVMWWLTILSVAVLKVSLETHSHHADSLHLLLLFIMIHATLILVDPTVSADLRVPDLSAPVSRDTLVLLPTAGLSVCSALSVL